VLNGNLPGKETVYSVHGVCSFNDSVSVSWVYRLRYVEWSCHSLGGLAMAEDRMRAQATSCEVHRGRSGTG
jgi:hypothetical protein